MSGGSSPGKQHEKRRLRLPAFLEKIQFLGKRRRETSETSLQSLNETPSPQSTEHEFSEDVVSDFSAIAQHESVDAYPRERKEAQEAHALKSEHDEREQASTARESLHVNLAAAASNISGRQSRPRKGLRLQLRAPTPDPEEGRERAELEAVIAVTCTRELRIEGHTSKVDPSQLEKLAVLGVGSFGYVELMICKSGPLEGRKMAVKKVARHWREKWWSIRKDLSYTKSNPHENVITYYGSLATTDEVWLCTESLDFSLEALVKLGRIDEMFVAHIVLCMVRGLHHLSTLKRRIIHRDVHPGNVLLSFSGCVKLIDFGLSAELVHTTRCSGTMHAGKPQYLAPECRTTPVRFGIRSDVWAVGITASEAATGSRPFEEVLTLFSNPAKPLSEYLSRECSNNFNGFVTACLAVQYPQRPLHPELLAMPLLVDAAEDFESSRRDLALWLQALRSAGLLLSCNI